MMSDQNPSDPFNVPGSGLKAPISHARDDDPLGPGKLAQRNQTALQVFADWEELHRLNRQPEFDPNYHMLRDALRKMEEELPELIERAEARAKRSWETYNDIVKLEVSGPSMETITAKANAGDDLDNDRITLQRLQGILRGVKRYLGPR